jgi:DsbC/DsbD-like thiol-disulfide interchange protein
MHRTPLTLALALTALLAVHTARAQTPAVQVTAVADVSAIQPAQPFHVAITISPPPEWHIYWKNPGDSGLPTKVKWAFPPNFSAGDLQFPLPQKFVLPGNIIAYGYDAPTTFLATITPPKDLKPGDTATIAATASWLCCKEECVPGQQKFQLALPVSDHALPANDSLFKQAQSRMPADAPTSARQAAAHPEISPTPDGEFVTLHLGLPALPCEVFPLPTPDLTISDIVTKSTPAGNDIQFKVHPLEGRKITTQHLPILIVYTNLTADRPSPTDTPNTAGTGFYLNVDISGPAPAGHP